MDYVLAMGKQAREYIRSTNFCSVFPVVGAPSYDSAPGMPEQPAGSLFFLFACPFFTTHLTQFSIIWSTSSAAPSADNPRLFSLPAFPRWWPLFTLKQIFFRSCGASNFFPGVVLMQLVSLNLLSGQLEWSLFCSMYVSRSDTSKLNSSKLQSEVWLTWRRKVWGTDHEK